MARITSLGGSIRSMTTTAENSDGITINIDVGDADAAQATAEIAEIETENSIDELQAEQVDMATTSAESAHSYIRSFQRNGAGVGPAVGTVMIEHLSLLGHMFGMRSKRDFATMPSAESTTWSTPSRLPPQ